MGILDMLLGNTMLDNRTIASDMLKDSKFAVFALAQAVTETADRPLRELLAGQLLTAVQQHHQLSDLVKTKEWYQPFLAPEEQLGEDLKLAKNLRQ